MKTLLVVGATGLVGGEVLELALHDSRVAKVMAPTRRALAAHARLHNPQVPDLGAVDAQAPWWEVDSVVCALGTTLRDAGSRARFRQVDLEYPLQVARSARRHGATAFVLTSASGAGIRSPFFYSRTKGQLEQALQDLGYVSLTFVRPALLLGERARPRAGEAFAARVLGVAAPLLPRRYRPVSARAVAGELLAAAVAPTPGTRIIESEMIGARAATS